MQDALSRAFAYVEAGADGIMIHSRKPSPDEVFEFSNTFRKNNQQTTLICVPTSYNNVSFNDIESAGFNGVIYANHLFRASYTAMETVANRILEYGRTHEIERSCLGIPEILRLIPGTF